MNKEQKKIQESINNLCIIACQAVDEEYKTKHTKEKQLDHKQAWYCETDSFIVLRSYNTLVCAIDKEKFISFDFAYYNYDFADYREEMHLPLSWRVGNGSTTKRQIARFNQKMGADKQKMIAKYYVYRQI